MRKTKRLMSLLLTVAMLITSFAVPVMVAEATETKATGVFSDVTDDVIYAEAVKTLNLMGIINGYPDGTFGPLNNVTRAEFTAMLMRTLGLGNIGSATAADMPFTDIDDSDTGISWAIPNINTAYGMGIINGYDDLTFRPKDNVAYEEAVKMVVCALGYSSVGVATDGAWYTNYIAQANKLAITKKLGQIGSVGTPASRACIAQMLYDSLEVPMLENDKLTDKTILTDCLGYIKNTGMVASDGVTGLTEPDVDLRNDEVQIYAIEPDTDEYETHTYKTTDASLKNYLGYQINFYYKNDGSTIRNLAFYVLVENEELKIDPALIEVSESSATQIKYYKTDSDKKPTSIALDKDNIVIYNGKLYGENESESAFDKSMIPEVGTMTLIDSNGDGKYEFINIKDYEIYYVSSKITSEYSIIDNKTRKGDSKTLKLDVEDGEIDTTILNASGNEIQFGSIATGNVICLARSNAGNGGKVVQTAVVVTETVKGTIKSVESGESCVINDQEYKYSLAAPWMNGSSIADQPEPVNQDTGVFCLDINGRIVAYEKQVVNETISYGYIMGYGEPKDKFDDTITLRILTQTGKEIFADVAGNTKFDGETQDDPVAYLSEIACGKDSQLNKDDGATNVTVQQPIKYSTRTSGGKTVLNKVITMQPTEKTQSEITTDKLYFYSKVDASKKMTYTSSSKQLKNTAGVSVNIGSAIVFAVPSDRKAYDDYAKKTSSAFASSLSYKVELFDVTGTNAAKVVVMFDASAETKVGAYSPIYIIDDVYDEKNNANEGEIMTKLEGYYVDYGNSKGNLSAWLSTEGIDDSRGGDDFVPQKGDIFRAGKDRKGYSTAQENFILYSLDGGAKFGTHPKESVDFDRDDYAVIIGTVMAKDDASITVRDEDIDQSDDIDPDENVNIFNFSRFSNARVLKYDNTGSKLEISDLSADYQAVLNGLNTYKEGASNPSQVLIYAADGVIRLLVILPTE